MEKLEADVSWEEIIITDPTLRGRWAEQVQVEHTDFSTLSAHSELILKCLWGCQAPEGLLGSTLQGVTRGQRIPVHSFFSAQHVCPSSQPRSDQCEVPH